MARPEIDTMDGVIYHGEDKAEKRYKQTNEITNCPICTKHMKMCVDNLSNAHHDTTNHIWRKARYGK